MELSDTEPVGRAARLLRARGGQLGSGRDLREIANALGAIGCDHEMGFASLPRQMINLVCYGGAFVGSA